MTRTQILTLTVFFLGLICAPAADMPLKIADIKVRLFFHHSGTFSEKLTGKEQLWNTMIGEGWAREPSTAALVDITVKGLEKFDNPEIIELTVKNADSKKIIATHSQPVGMMSKSGNYHAPFWLNDTGCQPLQLIAAIQGTSEKREAIIPFACGE